MDEQILRERVPVLFHLNGYTKVLLERTEGLGLADGGVVWEIATNVIPAPLEKIEFHSSNMNFSINLS